MHTFKDDFTDYSLRGDCSIGHWSQEFAVGTLEITATSRNKSMHCYPYPYGVMSVQIDVDPNQKCPNLQIFLSFIIVVWRGTTEVGLFFFSLFISI